MAGKKDRKPEKEKKGLLSVSIGGSGGKMRGKLPSKTTINLALPDEREIKPQIAQIECHPLAQRTDARTLYNNNYDIQVECWYPLNHNLAGTDVDNTVLNQIADAHGKTVYQIILRWHLQEGIIALPKASRQSHIEGNIDLFDFMLTDAEMAAIRALDTGKGTHDPEDMRNEEMLSRYNVH